MRERNIGEKPHGILQVILSSIFHANLRSWRLLPILEHRVQTSASHYRIPDLCLVDSLHDPDPIVRTPPVLCVEILSKDDSLAAMQERVDDYIAMGVKIVWLIDPVRHLAWLGSQKGFDRVTGSLSVSGTPVTIELASIFAELDDLLASRL